MTCDNCLDTGHGNKGLSPYLDCTKCEVATIRARLNDKFPLAAKLYPDSLWGAYNEGVRAQQAAPAIPEGWISVKDRLPEMYTEVMVWPHPSDYCNTAELDRKGWFYGEYVIHHGHENVRLAEGRIEFWMPLPPAPEGKAK